jgi:hypothetical protein
MGLTLFTFSMGILFGSDFMHGSLEGFVDSINKSQLLFGLDDPETQE